MDKAWLSDLLGAGPLVRWLGKHGLFLPFFLLWMWIYVTPAAATTCPYDDDLLLQDRTITETVRFQACQTLTAGPAFTVGAGAHVDLRAGQRITLKPGVRVARGATLTAAPGLLPAGRNQVLGPVAGALIQAYRLNTTFERLEGPIVADQSIHDLGYAGTFDLTLAGVSSGDWVLVSATGGEDLDADNDGVLDTNPTPVTGTLHALAKAADWRAGGVKVSALTDLVWRYILNLAQLVHPNELALRLNEVLSQLILSDLTGDGQVTLADALRFDPANATHRAALNFDWLVLFEPNDAGDSVILALRTGDTTTLGRRLDQIFGDTLTRFPAPDSRYQYVRLKLSRVGAGRAADPAGVLLVDSALAPDDETPVAFVPPNAGQHLVLTATPAAGSRIVRWSGCDLVSADLTQCTLSLGQPRDLAVSFGATGAPSGVVLHDLSAARNTLYPNVLDAVAEPADAELIALLATIAPGDYLVGDTGDGFLRRVVASEWVDSQHYRFETVEASLDEVVGTGSASLSRTLTNGDLRGYEQTSPSGTASLAADAFSGLPGIRLVPSSDPADTRFRLQFGQPVPPAGPASADAAQSLKSAIDASVTLYKDSKGEVTATGTLDIGLRFNIDPDYCGLFCLEHLHMVAEVVATESLELAVTGSILAEEAAKVEVKLTEITFQKLKFLVFGVPVWITPKVEVFIGLSGQIEAEWRPALEFSQTVEGGFVYDRVAGFDWIGNLDTDRDWDLTETALTGEAKLPYIRTSPSFKIYDATGPSLPLQLYHKVKGELQGPWRGDPCRNELKVASLLGLDSKFKWDLSGGSKFGELLHLDQLEERTEFTIKVFEWPLKTWYPQLTCVAAFPFLAVQGSGLQDTVPVGSGGTLTSNLRLTNLGEVALPWRARYVDDDHIQVIPDHGTLAASDTIDVQIAVDVSGLARGVYRNPITFINDYDTRQPDAKTGTTQVPVSIDVVPVLLTAPVLVTASDAGPGRVSLRWSHDPSGTPVPIDGYRIDQSTDGGLTWQAALSVAGDDPRTAQVTGLPQGLIHLRVVAYAGAAVSPFSNVLSVYLTNGAPPHLARALNDTGIDWCTDETTNFLACPVDGYPWQDAQDGRDAHQHDESDGHAGFSFTKIANSGNPLPNSATLGSGANDWACTRDNVTGLIWEVKTDNGGLRDQDWTYSWYNPDAGTNGGDAGWADYGDNCFNTARCDTDKYVADVNSQGLCGATDWRLPNRFELESLTSDDRYNPAIDMAFFPNTPSNGFWSSSPDAYYAYYAWGVDFSNGYVYYYPKSSAYYVRLVRGGQ